MHTHTTLMADILYLNWRSMYMPLVATGSGWKTNGGKSTSDLLSVDKKATAYQTPLI